MKRIGQIVLFCSGLGFIPIKQVFCPVQIDIQYINSKINDAIWY